MHPLRTHSDYKARQAAGACRSCGRKFAFEPKRDRGMTDLTFKLAIEAVSDNGRLGWNDDHLYYDVCRRVRRRRMVHRLLRRPMVSLDRQSFELFLGRWIDAHGPMVGRLQRRVFAEIASDALATPVEAYGFEHLVVCDDDATVDMLLVNGFHAELKCPVLAYSGYPAHVYEPLLPLLRERPPATVVVIHSADADGCRLAGSIADGPGWFAGVELPRVVDAGLRPEMRSASAASSRWPAPATTPVARRLARGGEVARQVPPRAGSGSSAGADGRLARVLRGETEGGGPDGAGVFWAGDAWADGDDEVG